MNSICSFQLMIERAYHYTNPDSCLSNSFEILYDLMCTNVIVNYKTVISISLPCPESHLVIMHENERYLDQLK